MIRRSLDLLVIGGATRDIMFYTSAGVSVANGSDPIRQALVGFENGSKIMPSDCHFMLGGGGCNVSIGAARLGLSTAAVLSIGTDRDGDALLKDLIAERVQTFAVKRHSAMRTGFSLMVISNETGEHVAFLYRGANDKLLITQKDLEQRKTRWMYISSLGDAAWNHAAPVLRGVLAKRPIKLAWNPGESQLRLGYRKLRPILERTDVLLLNKDEAKELVLSSGIHVGPGLSRVPNLLKAIKRFGPELVVITDGARGAAVFNGHQVHTSPALRTAVTDTTGAGDAFGAGFVAGLRLFHDLNPALKLALKNSGSVCSAIGTQRGLLTWKDIASQFERDRS